MVDDRALGYKDWKQRTCRPFHIATLMQDSHSPRYDAKVPTFAEVVAIHVMDEINYVSDSVCICSVEQVAIPPSMMVAQIRSSSFAVSSNQSLRLFSRPCCGCTTELFYTRILNVSARSEWWPWPPPQIWRNR